VVARAAVAMVVVASVVAGVIWVGQLPALSEVTWTFVGR